VPCARHDRRGLALILDGNRVINLAEHVATIETASGAHLTYIRRPVEFLDVVRVDQIAPAYRLAMIRREWADVLERANRHRPPLDANVSETRWRQYLSDLHRLAGENWDFMPVEFMDWDGRDPFPSRARRALAWVMGEYILTSLTHDTAICGAAVFRRLPGDSGWQLDVGPFPYLDRDNVKEWLLD
jgi:hypothetical protein